MRFHGRIRVLLFAIAAVIVAAMPRYAHAQCLCTNYYVIVDANVACPITIMQTAPTIRFAPIVVNPGTVTPLGCVDDLTVTIDGCLGGATFLNVGTTVTPQCFFNVPISLGCCVDVCLGPGPKGCVAIRITPAAGLCVSC